MRRSLFVASTLLINVLPVVRCEDHASASTLKQPNSSDKKVETLQFENEVLQDIKSSLEDILPKGTLDLISHSAHQVMDSGAPGQLGYGFMMGYCSGYCVKKISKLIAFTVGGAFCTMQYLSWKGYANVNQDKLKHEVEDLMDLNHDGVIDAKDAKLAYQKIHDVLSYNVPVGGGFTAGLGMGLRG